MMKKLLTLFIAITITATILAQNTNSLPQGKNNVYGDVLVLVFINNFQINYERTIYLGEYISAGARIGLGSWTEWGNNDISVPLDLHLLFLKHKIHPEISFGVIPFYDNNRSVWKDKLYLLYGIGLRYQHEEKGGFIRLKYEYCDYYNFMPGLSIGYNF